MKVVNEMFKINIYKIMAGFSLLTVITCSSIGVTSTFAAKSPQSLIGNKDNDTWVEINLSEIDDNWEVINHEDIKQKKLANIKDMYIPQKGENECWFASYAMIKGYISGFKNKDTYQMEKENISKMEIFKDFKQLTGLDPFKHGAGGDLICGLLNQQSPSLNYHVTFYNQNTPDKILTSLHNNKPVIVGLNDGNKFGHYIVVVGIEDYDTECVIWYFDPARPQKNGEPKTGILKEGLFEKKQIGDVISM